MQFTQVSGMLGCDHPFPHKAVKQRKPQTPFAAVVVLIDF